MVVTPNESLPRSTLLSRRGQDPFNHGTTGSRPALPLQPAPLALQGGDQLFSSPPFISFSNFPRY